MALVKVRELLEAAQKANTSILAFDACDYNTIYACIKGAETARRPVIVMLYPSMRSMFSFGAFAAAVKDLACSATVPVGLHLDHCSEPTVILEAIRDGFTSVMADGSAMPFEENVAFTKSVVDMAKVADCSGLRLHKSGYLYAARGGGGFCRAHRSGVSGGSFRKLPWDVPRNAEPGSGSITGD